MKKKVYLSLIMVGILFSVLATSFFVHAESNQKFSVKGKDYILKSIGAYSSEQYELYVKNSSGYNKVATLRTDAGVGLGYVSNYKNKMLFNWDDGTGNVKVYSYTIGKEGFKLLTNNLSIDYIR